MSIEIKDADSLTKAVHDMREAVEAKSAQLAENKDKIAKLEDQVAKFLDKESEEKSKVLAIEKKNELLQEQITDLELSVSRAGSKRFETKAYKNSNEYKALVQFAKSEPHALATEFKSYLRSDVDSAGGFLVPPEMSNELERNIIEISPMRQICRIKRTNSRVYTQPIRTTNLSSSTPGEGVAVTQSRPRYELFEIKVNKIVAQVAFTLEELQDAAFDLESEVNSDMLIEFERQEGQQFIKGQGATQAIGIMTDTNISYAPSGIANDITFDNFIDLQNIKVGYTLTYAMNRTTLLRAMKIKNNVGEYLWNTAVEKERFSTLYGHRYIIMQDMDSVSANTYPVICGDFSRGYTIVDRMGMMLIRDVYTEAAQNIVILTGTRRVGGQCTKPEAFLKLKVAIS